MLLFDTHALVWLASTRKNLSARARHSIQQHSDELYVSLIGVRRQFVGNL